MNKTIILFSLLVIAFSCNKQTKKSFQKNNTINFTNDSFNTVSRLNSEELKKISDSILVSYRIKIDKNYIYLNEIKSNKFLNIIKLPEEDFIGAFGNKGKGPCETIVAWDIDKSDSGTLLILDPKQKKVVEFNVDSLINKKACANEYKLNDKSYYHKVLKKKNKLYYTDENNREYRFFESDLNGENIKGHGIIQTNITFKNPRKNLTGNINNVFMVNHENLFVFGYYYYPLIELFDIETKEWKSIVGPTNEIPDDNFKQGNFIYSSTRITNKYIYALYAGKSDSIDVNIIFVFNLKGEPIKKLILDKGIFNFDVYNDKYIYGLNFADSNILKFKID